MNKKEVGYAIQNKKGELLNRRGSFIGGLFAAAIYSNKKFVEELNRNYGFKDTKIVKITMEIEDKEKKCIKSKTM